LATIVAIILVILDDAQFVFFFKEKIRADDPITFKKKLRAHAQALSLWAGHLAWPTKPNNV
jgi:hypothetical protein